MLCLSRKRHEEIVIEGGRIVISVVGFRRGGAVVLGIECDPSISVNRREVQDKIDEQRDLHVEEAPCPDK